MIAHSYQKPAISKKQEFSFQIRKKQRQQCQSNIRNQIILQKHLDQLLLELQVNKNNPTEVLIDQIVFLLKEIQPHQTSPTTLAILKRLLSQQILYRMVIDAKFELRNNLLYLVCQTTQMPTLTKFYTQNILYEIVKQITQRYLDPQHLFFQSIVAIGNILTQQAKQFKPKYEIESCQNQGDSLGQILEYNSIQGILSDILGMRNRQFDEQNLQIHKYFQTDSQEETIIWFIHKYLKYSVKQNSLKVLDKNLSEQIQLYIIKKFRKFSQDSQIIADSDLEIYRYLVKIMLYIDVEFSKIDKEKVLIQLISNNLSLQSTALLWKILTSQGIIKPQVGMIVQVFEQIYENGQDPITTIRDNNYLNGFICTLSNNFNPEQAVELWQDLIPGKLIQCIANRNKVAGKLSQIQTYIEQLRNCQS